jgi:hypothetical protein
VSYNKLFDVEIVWDSRAGLLKWKDVVIGKTRRLHNQWVLEYKKVEMAYPAVSTYTEKPKAKWTIQEAYEKTGHTFPEALRHLPEACQDIASVTGEHDPACETCRKFDAHRQISRRQPNRAHQPFHRLYWDVVPMRDGFIVHMNDDMLGFQFVEVTYTTQARELVKSIRKIVNTIRRR